MLRCLAHSSFAAAQQTKQLPNNLSARASTLGGIMTPMCLAVFRLMTSSNLFGLSMWRSQGLRPWEFYPRTQRRDETGRPDRTCTTSTRNSRRAASSFAWSLRRSTRSCRISFKSSLISSTRSRLSLRLRDGCLSRCDKPPVFCHGEVAPRCCRKRRALDRTAGARQQIECVNVIGKQFVPVAAPVRAFEGSRFLGWIGSVVRLRLCCFGVYGICSLQTIKCPWHILTHRAEHRRICVAVGDIPTRHSWLKCLCPFAGFSRLKMNGMHHQPLPLHNWEHFWFQQRTLSAEAIVVFRSMYPTLDELCFPPREALSVV